MSEHTISLTVTTNHNDLDIEGLHEHIEAAINDVGGTLTQIDMVETTNRPVSMDPDELGCCPFCDGTELSVQEIVEEIYTVTSDGNLVYIENGHENGPVINIYCCDCHTALYEHSLNNLLVNQ